VRVRFLPAARVKVMDAGADNVDVLLARLDRLYHLLSCTPRLGRRPGIAPEDLAFLEERPQR